MTMPDRIYVEHSAELIAQSEELLEFSNAWRLRAQELKEHLDDLNDRVRAANDRMTGLHKW